MTSIAGGCIGTDTVIDGAVPEGFADGVEAVAHPIAVAATVAAAATLLSTGHVPCSAD